MFLISGFVYFFIFNYIYMVHRSKECSHISLSKRPAKFILSGLIFLLYLQYVE